MENKEQLLGILKERFEANMSRHPNLNWDQVESEICDNATIMMTLFKMEQSGGEIDVVDINQNGGITFVDCSAQSPKRRSICYDEESRVNRKKFPPESSAVEMCEDFGCTLLDFNQYKVLQSFGDFDTKSSTWIQTPSDIRELKGALFAEKRYNNVFCYHNSAESYYAARGFRGYVVIK